MKREAHRPSEYTPKIAEEICKRIASGESVRTIVKDNKMPSSSTVFRWLLDERYKEFWEQYEKARNIQAEIMFEELLDIADDGTNDWMEKEYKDGGTFTILNPEAIGRSRLRVDTRKWYLSKVLPKKFGDKLDIDNKTAITVTNFEKLEEQQLDAIIAQLKSRVGESVTGESKPNIKKPA